MYQKKQSEKIVSLIKEAEKHQQNITLFFKLLKKKKPKQLDDVFHNLHNEVFKEIDCLECANCCSTIGPVLHDRDIERLAKAEKTRPSDFIDQFVRTDEDNDYVFNQSPCPFLLPDNFCMHYKDRPKACREYPHTDRKRMVQILSLTAKNAVVCPAVFLIYKHLIKSDSLHLV